MFQKSLICHKTKQKLDGVGLVDNPLYPTMAHYGPLKIPIIYSGQCVPHWPHFMNIPTTRCEPVK